MTKLWKLLAGFEIRDIGHGFFMVKFDVMEDRCKVMQWGPRMIFDHYLAVSTWNPNFIVETTKVERMLA